MYLIMDFSQYLLNSGEIIGAISAIAVFVAGFYRICIRPIIKHIKEVREQFAKLDIIYKELLPNSGSSLKDAVNQIRNTVHTIEKRQRAWLSYEDQGIYETDENGLCIWTNRAYLKMLNATFDEVQGNGWKNFIHPKNREFVFSEWDAAVEDKRDFKTNIKYLSATNDEVCGTCEAFAIKDNNGKLTGYVGVITQVSLDKCL